MKISVLAVSKDSITHLVGARGILSASNLAEKHTNVDTQVWAYFRYDVPGYERRWHLWASAEVDWEEGESLNPGPAGSMVSLFRYPTPGDEE